MKISVPPNLSPYTVQSLMLEPLTPEEIKRATVLAMQLENGKVYAPDDMELLMKFLGKIHSTNTENPRDHSFIRTQSPLVRQMAAKFVADGPLIKNEISNYLTAELEQMSGTEAKKAVSKNLFKDRGFTAAPQLISDHEYQQMKGPHIREIFRGFKEKSEIEEFKHRDFYISQWTAGYGVYFSSLYSHALAYAGANELVITAKIDLNKIRFATNDIVNEAMFQEMNHLQEAAPLYNIGIYAAIKKLQMIERVEEGVDTYLLIDRSAIFIKK